MENGLILAALGALSILLWIVGGRLQPAPRRARPKKVNPTPQPGARPSMRLTRCARCGAWRVPGALCHDSRGYPRG